MFKKLLILWLCALPIVSVAGMLASYDDSSGILNISNVEVGAYNHKVKMIHQSNMIFKVVEVGPSIPTIVGGLLHLMRHWVT